MRSVLWMACLSVGAVAAVAAWLMAADNDGGGVGGVVASPLLCGSLPGAREGVEAGIRYLFGG